MAKALIFSHYLQQTLDQGILTPEQAWRLEWDLERRPWESWVPGVQQIHQRVGLYYLPTEGCRVQ